MTAGEAANGGEWEGGLLLVRQTIPSLTPRALERLGTDAAEMAVAAVSIVECLDIIEDIGSGEIARFVDAFSDALLLQAAEE